MYQMKDCERYFIFKLKECVFSLMSGKHAEFSLKMPDETVKKMFIVSAVDIYQMMECYLKIYLAEYGENLGSQDFVSFVKDNLLRNNKEELPMPKSRKFF